MLVDSDTFLVAVYSLVDDLYQASAAPHKPRPAGRPAAVSDSEILTLAVLGQWQGNSERALLRFAARHWRPYFPRLLDHSAFNRRVRHLTGVLVALLPRLAAQLGAALAPYQVLDGVPVPVARRDRGNRHRLFGDEVGVGCGGTDRDWYYGCTLLLAVTAEGVITGFMLGNASTDERYLADALFHVRAHPTTPWAGPQGLPASHRKGGQRTGPTGPLGPHAAAGQATGQPYVADNGLFGAAWQTHWREHYGVTLLTPRDLAPARSASPRRQLAGWRQVVERVNAQLEGRFHLWYPQAKGKFGLRARVAAKLLAHNLAIALNRTFGQPDLACATLYPW